MRILLIHNRYLQAGGEDRVFERERDLLSNGGHDVEVYERNNLEIVKRGKAQVAIDSLWSRQTYSDVSALANRFRPDIVHAHNTFPLVSPAAFYAAEDRGVPVVQTLHNYRIACLNATLLRDGNECRSCVGRVPWRGVVHRCYQGGLAQSAVLAASLTLHRLLGTYRDKIRSFIALTQYARNEFIAAGLPASRIVVKPNFVAEADARSDNRSNTVLYVGRLSVEKGISTLAAVAKRLPDVQFMVAGSGPDESSLSTLANVTLLGHLAPNAVRDQMLTARCLLIPSHCPEGMPMTLLEAFACGLPVVASDIGSLRELIEPRQTGLLFPVGDSAACGERLSSLLQDHALWQSISDEVRVRAKACYGPARNLRMLEAIYAACDAPAVAAN
jgi:glycosyltransferase involved in cell wall biosynthesis